MNTSIKTERIDALVLCGGLGKRLQSVLRNRQKVMAEIKNRPFLDILIGHVAAFGFRRFILCAGYRSDEIKDYYKKKEKGGLEILFSEENGPLDTGGAVKNAESFIKSSPFLAMNGDSLCRLDMRKFLDFHLAKHALASAALTKAEDNSDYGAVSLGKSYRIVAFNEKSAADGNSYINTGVYFFEKDILSLIPRGKRLSLEKDLFPAILDKRFFGYKTNKLLIDIGTPERYKKARRLLEA